MRSRLLTAFVLAACLIGVIAFAPRALIAALFGLILLIGVWEWSAFVTARRGGRLCYLLALALLGVLAFRYAIGSASAVPLMAGAVAWWIAALLWIVLAPRRVARAAAAAAGVLALLPTWVALVRIEWHWTLGPQWTLFILALAFGADTGAFFAGRRFGRRHLAPQVSPHKTWEGVIGGMLLALAVAAGGARWFGQPPLQFLPLCLVAAAFSVVGDLTESLLKRHVHLKDSGRLFPGHGGVLDRIDSVTAATPVMALGLIWLGAGR